ncbi:MAG: hypothetical protein WC135_00555 [Bacteroidales bacterium]
MKIKILVFIFLIQASFVFGQKNNPRKYFDNINKAELSIIDSNYSKACDYYKTAFKYLDEPFGKDLSNFLIWGFYTDDSVVLQMCYPKFIERKYNYGYFSKIYKSSKLASYWMDIINGSSIKSIIDTNFNNYISELMVLDQKYRSMESVDNIIFIQDSINMKNLYEYMQKNNVFLEEKTVGNYANAQNNINGEILLLHYSQSAQFIKNPINLNLREKVLEGKFDPMFYAHLCDYRGYGLDGNLEIIGCMTPIYGVNTFVKAELDTVNFVFLLKEVVYPKFTKKELKQIDKRRKEIYLCSYEDFVKKMEYEFTNMKRNRNQPKEFKLVDDWNLMMVAE